MLGVTGLRLPAVGDDLDQEVGIEGVRHPRQFFDGVEHRTDSALQARAVAGGAVLRVQGRPLIRIARQRGRPACRRTGRRRRGGVGKGGDAGQDEKGRYSERQEEASADSHLGQIISAGSDRFRAGIARKIVRLSSYGFLFAGLPFRILLRLETLA